MTDASERSDTSAPVKIRSRPRATRALQIGCVLALVALGLMVWSILDPRPVPVVLAMSVGQAIGTASLMAFGLVVLADFRRLRRAARELRVRNDSLAPRPPKPPSQSTST